MMRVRHGPILRPRRWRAGAIFLALLVLVVAGAMLAVMAGGADWTEGALQARAGHGLAVTVWGHGLESADAAAARADEILEARFGPERVDLLDPDARDPLLAKQVGAPADQQADARVIVIGGLGPGDAPRLTQLLAANALAGAAGERSSAPRHAIMALAAASGLMLVLMGLVAMLAVRGDLKANAGAVALMLRFGAARERIEGPARARGAMLVIAGALTGEAVAALATAVWARYWPNQGLGLMARGPRLSDLMWTGEFAVGAITVGLLAAWLGARGAVRRLA